MVTFGYLTPVYLLPTYVVKYGMDKTTGATLVGIYSGVNAASRILLGIAADRYGRFNVLFTCTFLGGLSCFVFWLNAKTLPMCVVFVVFYGINGGGFVSLFPVVAAEVVGVERLAAAVGMLYSGNLFGKIFLEGRHRESQIRLQLLFYWCQMCSTANHCRLGMIMCMPTNDR